MCWRCADLSRVLRQRQQRSVTRRTLRSSWLRSACVQIVNGDGRVSQCQLRFFYTNASDTGPYYDRHKLIVHSESVEEIEGYLDLLGVSREGHHLLQVIGPGLLEAVQPALPRHEVALQRLQHDKKAFN